MRSSPEIIAHRGFSALAPENTLASMERAIEAGAEGLEWDVRIAACGTPVAIHDARLDRTSNGKGEVGRTSWDVLAELDAGSWFSPTYAGEPIPTLAQILARIRRWTGRGYPEIKAWNDRADLHHMVSMVREAGLGDRITFISMEVEALREIRAVAPHVEVAPVVDSRRGFASGLQAALELAPAFLDVDHRILAAHPALAEEALDAGVELGVWTVNQPREAEALWAQGVTRFTTNEVAVLNRWAQSLSG
ncbi:MAG: glycerophosphodiester phosphodiesterase family protein [Gemmatimonadota bacterium]